jgi:hypothetical protein
MPEPVLVTEPDSPPPPAQAVPVASGTGLPGPGAGTAHPPITPPKPLTVPNARKGYKLTLWVSATTDAGVSDVNGLLQLDGADPVPFCMLKGVRNPLARALQEAYVAIERVRAKPPRMAAPTASPAGPQHGPRGRSRRPAPPRRAGILLPRRARPEQRPLLVLHQRHHLNPPRPPGARPRRSRPPSFKDSELVYP